MYLKITLTNKSNENKKKGSMNVFPPYFTFIIKSTNAVHALIEKLTHSQVKTNFLSNNRGYHSPILLIFPELN